MAFKRAVIGVLAASLAGVATAQSVTWEAVVLGGAGGRQVIAQGVRKYSPAKDIIVEERAPVPRHGAATAWWRKSLLLNDSFALSASVHRERSVGGFGLVIYRREDENGFSWEWFEREKGGVFQKLQGSGRLSVTMKEGPDYEELESVEFLDDVVLRYLDDMSKPTGTHTHEVIVRKGSVFRVSP